MALIKLFFQRYNLTSNIQYRSELSEPKTRVLNEPLMRLNGPHVFANAKGPRVFSNALAFVIHNQDSFSDALLW